MNRFERLTPKEVAAEYKIPESTQKVQRWARTHDKSMNQGPPFERVGRKILYRRVDVERWLTDQRIGGGNEE